MEIGAGLDQLLVTFDGPVTRTGDSWTGFTAETTAGAESPIAIAQSGANAVTLTFLDNPQVGDDWIAADDIADITFSAPLNVPDNGLIA